MRGLVLALIVAAQLPLLAGTSSPGLYRGTGWGVPRVRRGEDGKESGPCVVRHTGLQRLRGGKSGSYYRYVAHDQKPYSAVLPHARAPHRPPLSIVHSYWSPFPFFPRWGLDVLIPRPHLIWTLHTYVTPAHTFMRHNWSLCCAFMHSCLPDTVVAAPLGLTRAKMIRTRSSRHTRRAPSGGTRTRSRSRRSRRQRQSRPSQHMPPPQDTSACSVPPSRQASPLLPHPTSSPSHSSPAPSYPYNYAPHLPPLAGHIGEYPVTTLSPHLDFL